MMAEMLDVAYQRYAQYRNERFGVKDTQLSLDEFELLSQEESELLPDTEEIEEIQPEPKKKNPGKKRKRKSFLDSSRLPIVTVRREPEMTECPECGSELKEVEYRQIDRLCYKPAEYYIERTMIPVMICPKCTDDDGNSLRFQEEAEPDLIEGSAVTSEVVAHIAYLSYMAGVPFYRQEKMCEENGLSLSRQTIVNWLDAVYGEHLIHIVSRMEKDFRNLNYVHLDESTHKIVKNRKVRSTSYELVGVSGRSEEKQMVLYKYSRTRSVQIVPDMIGPRFSGTIQTDGFQNYHSYSKAVPTTQNIGC